MLQESFDDAVNDNMETFDMTVSLQSSILMRITDFCSSITGLLFTNPLMTCPCFLQREEAVESAVEEFEMQASLYFAPSCMHASIKSLPCSGQHCLGIVQGADLSGISKHAPEDLKKYVTGIR